MTGISSQEDKAELDNWSLDICLDQIIIEPLAKSHQAPQAMPTTTFQPRVKYG